ncbi:MAG: hypothetical protein IPP77_10050 [Bacteroidetes bacterium]|nr:hypothetical protein [Bacteroidota bacterium]
MKWILKIIGGFILFALAIAAFGYVTMYLWNWIMTYLFKLPEINFYMAIGMVILSKILFGGIRVRDGKGCGSKYWKAKMECLSPEDREKFKAEFASRCRSKWGSSE